MEAIRLHQKGARIEAAREMGAGFGLPKIIADQAQIAVVLASVISAPSVSIPSPIVTDPASPHFGKKKFILGISVLGGDDVMV